jgi:hypothetical protein
LDFRVICVAEVCVVCVLVCFPKIANNGVRNGGLGNDGDDEKDLENLESEAGEWRVEGGGTSHGDDHVQIYDWPLVIALEIHLGC